MKHALAVAAALLVTLAPTKRASASKQCVEVSEVVGERRCGRFGMMWSREHAIPFFAGIGMFSGLVQPYGRPFTGTVIDGNKRTPIDAGQFVRGPIQSHGINFRLGGYFARYGYLGIDWAFALGHARAEPHDTAGYRVAPTPGINFFQGRVGTLFGVRAPLGKVSLRLEVLTGLGLMFLSNRTLDANGVARDGATGGFAFVVEPRVAADFWVTPDTTLSLWAGSSVLRTGDHSFGTTLTFHLRAFDGAF